MVNQKEPYIQATRKHTAHFSTFEALPAHLTSASSRMKVCRVRFAKVTISVFLSMSVFLGNLRVSKCN